MKPKKLTLEDFDNYCKEIELAAYTIQDTRVRIRLIADFDPNATPPIEYRVTSTGPDSGEDCVPTLYQAVMLFNRRLGLE